MRCEFELVIVDISFHDEACYVIPRKKEEKKKREKVFSFFLQTPAERIAFSTIINTGETLLERTAHARMKRNNLVKNRY